jgi:pimeloyl-ACP methyl ester carboxylesterase
VTLTLDCRETGDGAPIVALHGIGGSARVWGPLASFLKGYRVLAYELPGHRAEPAPISLKDIAEAVRADLGGRALDRAVVCGHSLGALIALHLALAHPQVVSRLVLIATDPGPDAFAWLTDGTVSELARGRGMDAVFDYALDHDAAMRPVRDSPELTEGYRRAFARIDAEGYAALADALAGREVLAPRLREIRCPVLVVCGGADEGFVGPCRALAEATAGRYAEVPSAGHLPMLDEPGPVSREILVLLGEA